MKRYALGFLFNASHTEILLVDKQSPEWQRGLFNGIGGKVEAEETPLACLVRETKEESGLRTAHRDWMHLGDLASEGWLVSVYTGTFFGDAALAKQTDHEDVGWFSIDALPERVIQNLRWLIPLALESLSRAEAEPQLKFFSALYE